MVTRRQFVGTISISPVLFSGCTFFDDDRASIRELTVELSNGTESSQTFHFVLETTDGMNDWHKHKLEPDDQEIVTIEPEQGREYTAIHGIVDDQHTVAELDGLSGEVCPKVLFTAQFEPHVDNEPLLALTTRVDC